MPELDNHPILKCRAVPPGLLHLILVNLDTCIVNRTLGIFVSVEQWIVQALSNGRVGENIGRIFVLVCRFLKAKFLLFALWHFLLRDLACLEVPYVILKNQVLKLFKKEFGKALDVRTNSNYNNA